MEQHAQPLVEKWRHRRYAVVMRVLQKAATTYENLRRDLGGLNYQDLLLQAAGFAARQAQDQGILPQAIHAPAG